VETGLPRPILPIGLVREVREIADRSGMTGPPVEVMPLPENSFQQSDMTAEMLKDPRLLNLDTFEKSSEDEDVARSPDGGKPAEEDDAAYQLELGARKAPERTKSEALETMLAYERLGRSLRRVAPGIAPRPQEEAGEAKAPVSAPRPPLGGKPPSVPSSQGHVDEMAEGAHPVPPGLEEASPLDFPPAGPRPSGGVQGQDRDALGHEMSNGEPNTINPARTGETRPHGRSIRPPSPRGKAGDETTPVSPQRQESAEMARLRGAGVLEMRAPFDAAPKSSLARLGEGQGSIENLQILTKLPFSLYLFGGEMPRFTDEEEARAIPSRRKRRTVQSWTLENLTMADAVRLAAVLHNVYFGGDGAFEKAEPWYMPYLRYGLEQGIIGEGEFDAPEEPVTRGHFADILARCVPDAALPVVNPLTTVSDVKEGIGYGSSALKMVRAGVFAPVGPLELFDPERLVTRREASVYVGRILTPSDRRRF
jgi:hypothetical protein